MFQKLTSIKFFLLVTLLLIPSVSYARVKPTSNFYVNDYANVISDATEEHIIEQNVKLNTNTGAQIVVTTVTSLDGEDIETYANELFRDFGIGDKDKNNGVLILISTGDRKVRIEVGYGLEEVLTDGKSGRILDNYMIPSLKNNDYDTASLKGFDAIFNEVVGFYGLDDLEVPIDNASDFNDLYMISKWVIIIVILFYIWLKLLPYSYSSGRGHYHDNNHFGGFGGSSGGGFGGFSGGGGSSGGGGASRGF